MSGRVLVAGVGNLLRRDDGFGIEVARRLEERGDLPPGVRVIETSIAGIGLVQELMDRYDALLILDAVQRGDTPGTLYLLEPDVPDVQAWTVEQRHAFLADLHQSEPSRVLVLAAALGVLPPTIRILGCEPADCDEAEIGLTPSVEHAAERAVDRARCLVEELVSDRVAQPELSSCHPERSEGSHAHPHRPDGEDDILRPDQADSQRTATPQPLPSDSKWSAL